MRSNVIVGLANIVAGAILNVVASLLALSTLDGMMTGLSSGVVLALGAHQVVNRPPAEEDI